MRSVIESLAQTVADLSLVGRMQWLLRILAAVCSVVAFALIMGSPAGSIASMFALLLLIIGLLWATVKPDQEGALLVLAGIVPGAAFRSDLELLPAVIGAVLALLAHQCWAFAALTPAYARSTGAAWTLAGRFLLLTVLISAVLVAVVVLPGSLVSGGAWLLVLAAAGLLVLLTMLLPRPGVGED